MREIFFCSLSRQLRFVVLPSELAKICLIHSADPKHTNPPQVKRGFERRCPGLIDKIFERHAEFIPSAAVRDAFGRFPATRASCAKSWCITTSGLKTALREFDLSVHDEAIKGMFHILDHDDSGGLDIAEFRRALEVGSPSW